MRIVCPSCEAEYDVPDTMLAGGARKVRCARCAREWVPFAPPPPPPAEPDPLVEIQAPRPAPAVKLADHAPPIDPPARPVMKVPGGPPGMALVIAWLFTAAAIVAGIFTLWLKRPEIIHLWPPAARLYRLFGLD